MFENLAAYEIYISSLSLENLLDIEKSIDKYRYPERHDLVVKYIEKKRDVPRKKIEEGKKEEEKPENKKVELKDPVEDIKNRGGCLKSFLIFSGLIMFLRGGCRVIFGPKTFWEILLDLGIMAFGIVIVYTGLHLRKMVLDHPKIIYTLVITEVAGALIITAIKFKLMLTTLDIGLALLVIGVSWLVFNSAINLRMNFIKFGNVPNEPLYKKTSRQKKKGNKYFIGIVIIVIAMGVIKINLFPPTSIQKAYAMLLLKQPESALKEFEIIIRKKPNESEALVGAGICQTELKNFNKAIDYFETAINKNSEDLMLYVQIVYIVNHIMNNHDKTISILEKAKEIKEKNKIDLEYFDRIYLEHMGWAYYKKNDMKKALKYFKRARFMWDNILKTYKDHYDISQIHFYYGVFHKILNEKDEAVRHFRKVIEKTTNPVFVEKAEFELDQLIKK